MQYRPAILLERTNYTADETEKIDINFSDVCSRITVTYEPDNNPSGINATAHPARCIPKLELVDGSDELYSLTGQECQACDFYDEGKLRTNIMCYLNGMRSEMIFNMNFGNFLWDENWAFDPQKFKNPQLKIQMDIDGGGDESNDGYLTVLAHLFDEKIPSPRGLVMHKEHKTWTLVNATPEYSNLPTDYPYKQLFLRAQRYGTGPEYQIDTIKLSENQDKKVPINGLTMFEVLRNIAAEWPAYEEWILVPGSTTVQYFYNTPCYWPTFVDTQWRADVATAEASCYVGDGGRFQHDAEASGPNHQIHVRGWAPHAMVPLLPRFSIEPLEYYDVTKLGATQGALRLSVKGAADVGTAQTAELVIQQYRNY